MVAGPRAGPGCQDVDIAALLVAPHRGVHQRRGPVDVHLRACLHRGCPRKRPLLGASGEEGSSLQGLSPKEAELANVCAGLALGMGVLGSAEGGQLREFQVVSRGVAWARPEVRSGGRPEFSPPLTARSCAGVGAPDRLGTFSIGFLARIGASRKSERTSGRPSFGTAELLGAPPTTSVQSS